MTVDRTAKGSKAPPTIPPTPIAVSTPPTTSAPVITDAGGPLFRANDNLARVRRAHDGTVAQPAQLRLLDKSITPTAPVAPLAPVTIPTVESPLRAAFDSLAPKTTTAGLRFLPKNVDAWLGVWDIVAKAPDGVDASYFILERDIFGMSFLGALLEKAMKGDRVRLLVDSAGDYLRQSGFTLPTRGGDYLQELVEHGAEVRIYNPLHKKLLRWLMGKTTGFATVANNHDKLVRSSTTAQTGGRNLAKDYLSEPGALNEKVYRDTCVRIESKATSKELETAFEREFYQDKVTFQQFKDLFGNWRKRDGELLGAYAMMDAWVKGDLGLSPQDLKRAREDRSFQKNLVKRLVEFAEGRLPEVGCTRKIGFLTRRSLRRSAKALIQHDKLYGSYPRFEAEGASQRHDGVEVKVLDRLSAAADTKRDQLTNAIQVAAMSAQKRIRIHNPYVTLSEAAIAALEVAGRRGVKIELLTNSPASTDSTLTQAFFVEDWPRLVARIPNMRLFVLAGEDKLHAKSIEVDDQMTFVKSYNLDILSERVNSELGIVAWSESFAKAAGHTFDSDLTDPRQNVLEYRIQRDAKGRPVFGEDGLPIVAFGAKDHIDGAKWRKYRRWRAFVRLVRKLPMMAQHQTPRLPASTSRS